ncbi:MAG: hypothetical protein KatS3mg008_0964 [Acidimicrobiales bacterium]|nr:MAG: hypothetical protein KatS3mg008_0964 [Acidimicrobiales bacterium]
MTQPRPSEEVELLQQVVAELQALRRLIGTIFLVFVLFWLILAVAGAFAASG